MVADHGANLTITEWMDEHSEMLGEWEAQTRYNMDFLVEKRKLDRALVEVRDFLEINGITENLRRELRDASARERLLQCLPKERRNCNDFELNCYYIMFQKRIV